MLRFVETPLFESPAQTLVNTVNAVGVMGKGVALEFKKRYPEMFRRYAEFCRRGDFDVGKLYLHRTPNKWVLNFPTKKDWRNPSQLEYIERGLEKFVEFYSRQGITSISFPQLGCGNGGLSWRDVEPLMVRYLEPLPIPIYVHLRAPGAAFIPEHSEATNAINLPRRTISFSEFLHDLTELVGTPASEPFEAVDGHFPDVNLRVAGVQRSIPGGDLENFWDVLRVSGAIEQSELPSSLMPFASDFFDEVLRLDYVRPMRFRSGDEIRRGVRYAPSPARGDDDTKSTTAAEAGS
jgi:O-acetyl-ADP-ribose deacetylase (regulator of RNase III)